MGDSLKEIEFYLKLVPAFAGVFGSAIGALRSVLGMSDKQATQALVDHIDPSKPQDARVAAVLDVNSPNPTV